MCVEIRWHSVDRSLDPKLPRGGLPLQCFVLELEILASGKWQLSHLETAGTFTGIYI